jgi:hypothetical protein
MKKTFFASVLTAATVLSAPAMAETPGSQAAANCQISMWNTTYQVWPGTLALKVARFLNENTRSYFYTLDINETAQLCNTAGWRMTSWIGSAPTNFRASAQPFNGGVPAYRFRHRTIGSHFYTTQYAEYMSVLTNGAATWVYEGVAFHVPDVSNLGIRDQVDPSTGQTSRVADYPLACVVYAPGSLRKDCKLGPAPSTGLSPVYRFYSPSRGHYYTANLEEAVSAVQNAATNTYTYEGIGFWAFSPDVLSGQPSLPGWMTGVPYPR